jgi:alpha-L-fucosidase
VKKQLPFLLAVIPLLFAAFAARPQTNSAGSAGPGDAFTGAKPPGLESPEAAAKRLQWWREARFGMFIHWGPYAILGGVYQGHPQQKGGAEWIMNRCKIPVAEYQQIASTFNPVAFDAEAWVRLAQEAGMKYIVITAKHHDGFAMFKSRASRFNIVDGTPFDRDVLAELATACRKHGVKLGFYYSQAQDWNNPGGAAARRVMAEGWPHPDAAKIDAFTAANQGCWDPAQMTRTMDEYIDQVAVPQVKELLSNYGEFPAVLWWDTPVRMNVERAQKLHDVVRALKPGVITNNRLLKTAASFFRATRKRPKTRFPRKVFPDATGRPA